MNLLHHKGIIYNPDVEASNKEDPFSILSYESLLDFCGEIGINFTNIRPGILLATCFGGWIFGEEQLRKLRQEGPQRISAFQSTAWFPAAAQGQITIKLGLKCPALTFSTEFFAFYDALLVAEFWLSHSICDIVFVGAVEATGSGFLASSTNVKAPHSITFWYAFSNRDGTRVDVKNCKESRFLTGFESAKMYQTDVDGISIKGACALPLIVSEALKNKGTLFSAHELASIFLDDAAIHVWRIK